MDTHSKEHANSQIYYIVRFELLSLLLIQSSQSQS